MKFFWQLNDEQQQESINYSVDTIVHDAIDDGMPLTPITDEEREIKIKVDTLLEEARTLETCEERFDYLLSDETFFNTVYEIAIRMAERSFFIEGSENVINLDYLMEGDEEEVKDEDIIDDSLPEVIVPVKKKISELN
jgi:hypothetical protein